MIFKRKWLLSSISFLSMLSLTNVTFSRSTPPLQDHYVKYEATSSAQLVNTVLTKVESQFLVSIYQHQPKKGLKTPLTKLVQKLFYMIDGDNFALVPTRNPQFFSYFLSDDIISSSIGSILYFFVSREESYAKNNSQKLKRDIETAFLNDVRTSFCSELILLDDIEDLFRFELGSKKSTLEKCMDRLSLKNILTDMQKQNKNSWSNFIRKYNVEDFVKILFDAIKYCLEKQVHSNEGRHNAFWPLSILYTFSLNRSPDHFETTKIFVDKMLRSPLFLQNDRSHDFGVSAIPQNDLQKKNAFLKKAENFILTGSTSPHHAFDIMTSLSKQVIPRLFNMTHIPGEPTDCCESSFFNFVALFEPVIGNDLVKIIPERWADPNDVSIRRKIKKMSSSIDTLSYYDKEKDLKPSIDNFLKLMEQFYGIDSDYYKSLNRSERLKMLCNSFVFNGQPISCEVVALDPKAGALAALEPDDEKLPWTNVIVRFSTESKNSIFDLVVYENKNKRGNLVGHCLACSDVNRKLLMKKPYNLLKVFGINEENIYMLPEIIPELR